MMPLLVRVDNLEKQTSSQYAFTKSPVRIGRNPLNDLALDHSFVSQWHAVVQFNETVTQYFDLGSTNGTVANGQRVGKNVPVAVQNNTEFRIGPLRIYFARGPAPAHLIDQQAQRKSFGMTSFGAEGDERTMVHNVGKGVEATMVFNPESTHQDPRAAAAAGNAANFMGNIGQLRGAVGQLRPLYEAYRRSWNALYGGLAEVMRTIPAQMHGMVVTFVEQEFPAVGGEDQFRALATAQKVNLTGAVGVGMAAAQLLAQFAQYLVPSRKPPATAADMEKIVVRVAAVLEAFGSSYVAQRRGHDQFGNEMALPHHRDGGDRQFLNETKDPKEVLAYLLDWTVEGNTRVEELTSAYADLMIHNVALLNGMMEGVRSLLHRLGPAQIEKDIGSVMWPFRTGARWKQYVKRHREFTEEDREITSAIFGAEFARAYAGVVGENLADNAPKRLNDGRS
jgi:hypothetical protein